MGGLPPSVRFMRFGVFEVDLHSAELRKRGIRLNLQSQPFLLLVTLLKRQGDLVTREELCSTLWPDGTSVDFDHSLGTAVNKLREILGDSASSPSFIETLPRRGYRFIAPVEAVDPIQGKPIVIAAPPRDPELSEPIPILEAFRDSPYAPLLGAVVPENNRDLPKGIEQRRILDPVPDGLHEPLHMNCVRELPRRLAAKYPN